LKLKSTISEKAGFLYLAPFMDTVLLLLVFFILSSNFVVKSGVKVNLPSSNSSLPSERNSHIITIVKGPSPQIYFNESRVDMTQLNARLIAGKVESNQVTILADRDSYYGEVLEVALLALRFRYEVAFGAQPQQE
jgi:biopolymer transport protein ExbD